MRRRDAHSRSSDWTFDRAQGIFPVGVAEQYELSVSDVHRALAYYYDHPDEMDRYDRRERDIESNADEAAETLDTARDHFQRDSNR